MEAHEKLHGSFPCNFCEVKETYAPNLAIHELLQHGSRNNMGVGHQRTTCPRCGPETTFTFQRGYVQHHAKCHLSLSLNEPICAICKTTAPFSAQHQSRIIGAHFRSHHNLTNVTIQEEIKRCTKLNCDAYFLSSSQLREHLEFHYNMNDPRRKVEGEPLLLKFQCKDCEKSYSKPGYLRTHRLQYHVKPDKAISCTFKKCDKKFESKMELEKHIRFARRLHKSLDNPTKKKALYGCPECNRKIPGRGSLAKHIKSHRMPTPTCEICGKTFKEKPHLEVHRLSHSGPDSWAYLCSHGSRKCLTKQKLEEHMRTHTKEKPFVCEVCGEKYAHRHNLRNHVKSKHEDKVKGDKSRTVNRGNVTSKKKVKRKKKVVDDSNSDN